MGLLSGISKKVSEIYQKSKDKKEFFKNILNAAEDGVLTDKEITDLEIQYKKLGLTKKDLKGIRVQAYNTAVKAIKKDGIVTDEEKSELEKLQNYLMIPESEIIKTKKELARLRLLTEIQNGNLPIATIRNVIFQKNEVAYWSEPASIIEERVIRRRYEGGSQGFNIRIAKGLSYRVGQHRGQLVKDTEVAPVSSGDLVVTSKRVIFRGDTKSFSIRLDKLLDIKFYSDGMGFTNDKGKLRVVIFNSVNNLDIIGAILSFTINNYGNK